MPDYINGRLLLTEEETSVFRERLIRPSILAAERRDAFLADIEQTLTVTQVDGGVCLENSLKEHAPKTLTEIVAETDTYCCVRKPETHILSHYTRQMSETIEIEQMESCKKQSIRYGTKRKNESTYFEFLLSA